jgi:hypothetical protein
MGNSSKFIDVINLNLCPRGSFRGLKLTYKNLMLYLDILLGGLIPIYSAITDFGSQRYFYVIGKVCSTRYWRFL